MMQMATEAPSSSQHFSQSSLEALSQPQSSPQSQVPIVFRHTPHIAQGIRTLENFGFRTKLTEVDPSKLQLYRSRCNLNMGFHVTDLWSQRQQMEFLRTMRLQKAQFARERQAHFVNFLVESGKKLGKAVLLEDIQSDIDREMRRGEIEKYRSSGDRDVHLPRLVVSRPLTPKKVAPLRPSRHISPSLRPKRLLCLEDFIGHCNSTLKGFRKADSQLPESIGNSPKSLRTLGDTAMGSAISLRISRNKHLVQ